MISVEQLIGELLLRQNCVIIPSFGGFVAKQISATIDYKNGVMTPPRKSLLFNRQLINNDGLLIAELALQHAISYQEASKMVDQLVQSWHGQLKNGERVSLDKVGFLYFDQEKNICFEQDRFFNLLLSSYGLEKVHFLSEQDVLLAQRTTIARSIAATDKEGPNPVIVFDTETITTKTIAPEAKIIPHPELNPSKKLVWKYLAAACFLPIAFYSFWLPMKTNVLESGMLSFNDFNPFYKSAEGSYKSWKIPQFPAQPSPSNLEETVAKLPNDVTVFSYNFDEDLYIPIRLKNGTHLDSELNVEASAPSATQTTRKFELIVGCFSSKLNATNLISALRNKGFSAKIYDEKNGLQRVTVGSADVESNLEVLKEKITALGIEAWVLKN